MGEIDTDTFLAWARENAPDCIRVKEEPALSEVKARFWTQDDRTVAIDAGTGEVVPGITITPAETSYTVEVDL